MSSGQRTEGIVGRHLAPSPVWYFPSATFKETAAIHEGQHHGRGDAVGMPRTMGHLQPPQDLCSLPVSG